MKNSSWPLLLLLFMPLAITKETKLYIPVPPVIAVNVSQQLHNHTQAQISQSSNLIMPAPVAQITTLTSASIAPSLPFFRRHPAISAAGAVAGLSLLAYSTTFLRLLWYAHRINDPSRWSNWQPYRFAQEIPTDQHTQLAKEMYDAIKQRYEHTRSAYGPLGLLMQFLQDIDSEIAHVEAFLNLHARLEAWGLARLFSAQTDSRAAAQDQQARLLFIRDVMIAWATSSTAQQP